jgi:predicted membrane channel-forming protein YqfA (hemolysin III family)
MCSVSLLALSGVQPYMRVLYFCVVGATALLGVLCLALQNYTVPFFERHKLRLSLLLGLAAVLLFTLGRQPYATVFSLALLAFKAVMPISIAKKSDNGAQKRQ